MSPPPDLERFDRMERTAHWLTAGLFIVLMLTAAPLYISSISVLIGRRELMRTIHVYAGLALPLPLVVGVLGRRWGRALRADLSRINRWDGDDRRWIRTWGRDPTVRSGKFNAGQKLNTAFIGGVIVVMLATGIIMRWFGPFPLSWRTGATFVHDWVATVFVVTFIGHVGYALADRDALRAIITGRVRGSWALSHAPKWVEELGGVPPVGERIEG
ncbi:MAG: cytochrome b/b6 domain-containing protein [Acidimicrobiales bacterium]